MKKIVVLILASLLLVTLVTGCSSKKEETPAVAEPAVETPAVETPVTLVDGTYKAEGTADTYGWKAFVELEVKDAKISSVNFDYDNAGKMKSEDAEYKANMEATGTSPDVFIPEYEKQLLEKQDITAVDGVAGATQSFNDFTTLVNEALAK